MLTFFLLLSLQDDWRKSFDADWKTGDAIKQKAAVLALAAVDKKEVADVLEKAAAQLERKIADLARDKERVQAEMKKIPADSLLNDKGEIIDRNGYNKRLKLDEEAKKIETSLVDQEATYAAFADVYAKQTDPAALDALKSEHWRLRLHAVRGLGRHADVSKSVEDKDGRVAVAAIETLATRGVGLTAILAALTRPEWQVQLAAAKAIQRLDAVEGVEPLIAALEKADGRIKHEINDALVALTGENKHGVAQLWREWWEASKAQPRKSRDERKKVAANGEKGFTTFYGIPVKSKRMVFVLDRSGSMAEKANWKDDGSTATGAAESVKLVGDRKIDVCRYELKKALLMLPKDAEFNILFFNRDLQQFSSAPVKATPDNVKRAFAFIDSIEPQGRTNIFDSLERAMASKEFKQQVDTIFLLSDGLPNCGQFEAPADIRKEVARLNAASKITIHAVYVGTEAGGLELMQLLSKENGGVCVDRSKK